MAKKNATKAAVADVARTGKALASDRLNDYFAAMGIQASAFGDLRALTGKTGARLTSGNSRILDAMANLMQRQAALKGATAQAQGAAGPGAMSDYLAAAFAPARADAAAGATAMRGVQEAGRIQAQGSQDALALAKSGVDQAQASAAYATAQALSQRTTEDVKTLAAERHDIAMAKLQSELDYQNWQKQQKALGQIPDGNNMSGDISNITTLSKAVRDYLGEHPDASQEDVLSDLSDMIVDPTDSTVVKDLYRTYKVRGFGSRGYSQAEADELVNVLMQVPEYRKHSAQLRKAVEAALRSLYSGVSSVAPAQAPSQHGLQGQAQADAYRAGAPWRYYR